MTKTSQFPHLTVEGQILIGCHVMGMFPFALIYGMFINRFYMLPNQRPKFLFSFLVTFLERGFLYAAQLVPLHVFLFECSDKINTS